MRSLVDLLDRSLSMRQLLWSIPLLLIVHNVEEALTMPRWVMENLSTVQRSIPFQIHLQFSPVQLLTSLAIATVLPVAVAALCVAGAKGSRRIMLLFVLQAIVLLNVFVPHIAGAFRLGSYNPGVVTAVCFNLPFSVYLFRRAYREEYLNRRGIVTVFLVALILYPPTAWTIHFAGEWISKSL